MRADRLLDLVALLRRHERLTAATLAERLGVSRRTVLRDLDALSLSGVPVYAAHGRGGGYSILPGYRPETAGLTTAESEALFLPGGEIAADAVGRGTEFRWARRKLEAVLSDEAARGVDEVTRCLLVVPEGWATPAETPAAVAPLAAAAARREIVEIGYRAPCEAERTRRVRPFGVVLAGRTWYVVAERDDSGARRTYRADRIGAITTTGRRFVPSGSLADAWERARTDYAGRDGIEIRLRTDEASLPIVRRVVSLAGRVIDERPADDLVEITALVERLAPTAGLLTGLAHLAEVTHPPALVEAIVETSRRNLERYACGSPGQAVTTPPSTRPTSTTPSTTR